MAKRANADRPAPGAAATDAAGSRLAPRPVAYAGGTGLTLVGDARGSPEAPPVLFLPGGGQTRHAWAETAEAVARAGWRAVTLDLRGHGDSAWAPDGDYSLDAFADDVRAVVNAFGAPPVLVGASLGGLAGLVAAGEAPAARLRALVLVDVAPRLEPEGVSRIVAFMQAHLDGFPSLEAAADAVAAYLPHRPRPADLSGLEKNLRRGPDGRYRWHWDPAFVAGARRPDGSRQPERLFAAARRLALPVLLVRGRSSDVLSEAGAAEFLAAVPHAGFVDVSQAGHMVAGDRNTVFTDAVLEFLGRLERL